MDYSKIFAYEIPDNKLLFEEKVFLFRNLIPGPVRRLFAMLLFFPCLFIGTAIAPLTWLFSWILLGNELAFYDKQPSNEWGSKISFEKMEENFHFNENPETPYYMKRKICYCYDEFGFRGFSALFLHNNRTIKFYRMIKNGKIPHYKEV